MRHLILTSALSSVTGCSGDSKDTDKVVSTNYFYADIVITLESNQMRLEDEYWVERILDFSDNLITENWTAVDGTQSAYLYQVHPESMTFDIAVYMEGVLDVEGEGVFEGSGLAWTFSEHTYQNSDGVTEITQRNYDESQIVSGTVGYGMDGQAEWTLDEILRSISEQEWADAVDVNTQE